MFREYNQTACPADVARRDRMVGLVEKMLDLNRRLAVAKAPHETEVLAGMIDATCRQIDRLVYDLYGLAEDEIAIVEGSTHERPRPYQGRAPPKKCRKEIQPEVGMRGKGFEPLNSFETGP